MQFADISNIIYVGFINFFSLENSTFHHPTAKQSMFVYFARLVWDLTVRLVFLEPLCGTLDNTIDSAVGLFETDFSKLKFDAV